MAKPRPSGASHSTKTDETRIFKVRSRRGRRIFIDDFHFHTGSSVFLPRDPAGSREGVDTPREFSNDAYWNAIDESRPDYVDAAKDGEYVPPEDDGGGSSSFVEASGLELILAGLRVFERHPDHSLVVAGHTDRVGSASSNEALSGTRAKSVASVLSGDRAGYLEATRAHDKPESDGSMLSFAAETRGYPCDPQDPAHPTKAEIRAFQAAYNREFGKAIGEDGIVGDRTRGAYFDILEDTLARQAGGVEALAALRAKTRFVDDQRRTLPCGERFPIERPGEDGVASAKNRRVELLYFPPAFEPDLSVDDIAERIYDRRLFRFDDLDPTTLEVASPGSASGAHDEFQLVEVAASEGADETEEPLETHMTRLQTSVDPADPYGFIEPFGSSSPDAGNQAVRRFPKPRNNPAVV
ncbi:MAG: OmpA family protein [Planctomycetes bacterium]|nr:OmpA family protein [Planctomycetota bacterium]